MTAELRLFDMTAENYKLAIVGDACCGKTCLLRTFSTNRYPTEFIPTVSDNIAADVRVNDRLVRFGMWDTSGLSEYDKVRSLTYPGTDIILVCFSVDSPDSFNSVAAKWQPEVRHHLPQVPIIVVGNKKDLRCDPDVGRRLSIKGRMPISSETGQEVAGQIGAVGYVECSALTGEGVRQVFEMAAEVVLTISGSNSQDDRKCVVM